MSSPADDLELKEDPARVRAVLAEAEERRKQARQILREADPRRAAADATFMATETDFVALKAENTHIEAFIGPSAERAEREHALSTAQMDLDRRHREAAAHIEGLQVTAADLDSAEAAAKRARTAEEAAEKRIQTLREEVAGLTAEIRARSEEAVEEKWRETTEALSAAETRVAAFDKEVATLQRLASALESARSEARELYLRPVVTELRPLLGLLFDDVSITFDEKTLLPQTILRRGQEEDVERLSGGMREQLSVLTRLAFARLLAKTVGRPGHSGRCASLFGRRPHRKNVQRASPPVQGSADHRVFLPAASFSEAWRKRPSDGRLAALRAGTPRSLLDQATDTNARNIRFWSIPNVCSWRLTDVP